MASIFDGRHRVPEKIRNGPDGKRFDHHAHIGHDSAHIGLGRKTHTIEPKKPRGCALYQNAATRPRRAFRALRPQLYASELIRTAGTGSGAAQRELARLEKSGLVVGRRIGHQKHYQANRASPLFEELRSMVLKTVGLAEPLRTALKPLSSDIRAAFVYGSVAKAADRSESDIDLMLISGRKAGRRSDRRVSRGRRKDKGPPLDRAEVTVGRTAIFGDANTKAAAA